MIERIDIISHEDDTPRVVASVWFSEESGLSCDSSRVAKRLREGIVVPPGKLLKPDGGRSFFDGLRFEFRGLIAATQPVEDSSQGGDVL